MAVSFNSYMGASTPNPLRRKEKSTTFPVGEAGTCESDVGVLGIFFSEGSRPHSLRAGNHEGYI